jgi:hypothetical protein
MPEQALRKLDVEKGDDVLDVTLPPGQRNPAIRSGFRLYSRDQQRQDVSVGSTVPFEGLPDRIAEQEGCGLGKINRARDV